MDIGESIFRAWLRRRKRHSEKSRCDKPAPDVELNDKKAWLTSLGVLLAEDLREIRGGSIYDGLPASFYLFPERLSILPTAAENEVLLAYRLLYLTESEKLGLYLPPAAAALKDQLIFSLLAEPLVSASLMQRFTGAIALRRELYAALLKTRRRLASVITLADCLEFASQRRLGARTESGLPGKPLLVAFARELLQPVMAVDIAARSTELMRKSNEIVASRKERYEPVVLWGVLSRAKPNEIRTDEVPEGRVSGGDKHVAELPHTVRLQKPGGQKKPQNPLFHSFETTESLEDYQGESNEAESVENLAEDQEALQDLRLGHLVRTFDDTPGLLRADIADDPAALVVAGSEVPTAAFHYDEWDYRTGSYKCNWCCLFETRAQASSGTEADVRISAMLNRAKPHIADIRAQLLRLLSMRTVKNRQLDGPEIDIDAVVERHADLAAGRTPPERLYLSERTVMKDIAVLLLVDSSLSTDGWVHGRRVLDVEIESILILAKAFEGLFDNEVAVAHFNSRTRNECRFSVLKEFSDPWSRAIVSCAGVEPFGYTRIGPAIRHAVTILKNVKAKRKFLLIVSDGKPTDYDQYEGRYGVRDVAQAVREARQLSITTFGLAVEQQPKHYLAEMFGAGRFQILPKSDLLPSFMAGIFMEAIS